MMVTKKMAAIKRGGPPRVSLWYVLGVLVILGPSSATAEEATESEPTQEVAKRAGGKWHRDNFEFAAVEARVVGTKLASSDGKGYDGIHYWTEVSLDVIRSLGQTNLNSLEAGRRVIVLDRYPLVVHKGAFKYKTSSVISTNSEYWNELQLGIGDHVLLLLGKSNKSNCGTPWWSTDFYGTGYYSIWLVRQVDDSSDRATVVTKRLAAIRGKAMALSEGAIDANLIPRESIAGEYTVGAWRGALSSFVSEERH